MIKYIKSILAFVVLIIFILQLSACIRKEEDKFNDPIWVNEEINAALFPEEDESSISQTEEIESDINPVPEYINNNLKLEVVKTKTVEGKKIASCKVTVPDIGSALQTILDENKDREVTYSEVQQMFLNYLKKLPYLEKEIEIPYEIEGENIVPILDYETLNIIYADLYTFSDQLLETDD